jgi:three-Cys-motif partner protein
MRRIKDHTYEKLQYFKKYLNAYLSATKRLPKKYYIDAFAGTGKCILCNEECDSKGDIRCIKCGKGKEVDGSALIALKAKNKFNGYLLIELNKQNFTSLEKFIKNETENDLFNTIKVKEGDSNVILKNVYKYFDNYTGCLVFLDPVGPELYWETIESLSKIKKVDLFILYPYDMSLVRLVKDQKFKERLDKFYGNTDWFRIFKEGVNPKDRSKKLLNFYLGNLKGLGFPFVFYRVIRTKLRQGKSLYHFILATKSPIGGTIIESVFGKELDGQQKLLKI